MAELSAAESQTLLDNTWFAALPAALRAALVGGARRLRLADGETLFLDGQEADGWYGVLEGAIKVRHVSADGRERVLTWLEPGTWFGEISLLDGAPRIHDGLAAGATTLLLLPTAAFEDLLERHPRFGRALAELQSRRLRLVFALLAELSTLPLETRLARQLLNLAASYGRSTPEGTRIELHLPQDELAQLMGVSRQRINQALKAWERQGALTQRYGRIVIVEAARLG
jgi:CRP/FNR family transcriptional regulator, cyclic AMP receptor protein